MPGLVLILLLNLHQHEPGLLGGNQQRGRLCIVILFIILFIHTV